MTIRKQIVDEFGCRPEDLHKPHEILDKGYGHIQYVYHLREDAVQRAVETFMNSPRQWTAYPVDRIEVILRTNNYIPQNAHYSQYLEDSKVLVFIVNNRSHGEPRWLDNAKSLIKRLFS